MIMSFKCLTHILWPNYFLLPNPSEGMCLDEISRQARHSATEIWYEDPEGIPKGVQYPIAHSRLQIDLNTSWDVTRGASVHNFVKVYPSLE